MSDNSSGKEITVPPIADELGRVFADAGHELHLVGGPVRDAVLRRSVSDLDFTTAAAVPLAGLTALQALRDELAIKPGQRLFISGGAGGVGTFAIQIAKVLGAHVTTTASPRASGGSRSRSVRKAASRLTRAPRRP